MSRDFLSMPDDELPEFAEVEREMVLEQEQQQQETEESSVTEPEQETETEEEEEQEESAETSEEEVEEEEQEEVEEVNPLNEPDDKVTKPAAKPAKTEKATEVVEEGEKPKPTEEVTQEKEKPAEKVESLDPAAFQTKILAPFKANGKEIQVKDADEAVRLMQMGANYNLKMSALKPSLGMMRQLDEAGLLNPDTVANVIDLLKHKNPAAIAKLAKDAGVDPLDVKEEDVNSYVPKAAPVDESREQLESVLDEIQHSPSYARVLKTVQTYDKQTKELITQQPAVLKYFDQHMQSGIYDTINAEIDRRKATGSLGASTPFLQAYKQIGDELNAQGAFNHLAQASATEPKKETPAAPVKRAVKAASPAKETVLDQRRKAAAPTKAAATAPKTAEFNPLTMSDEEFEKLAGSNQQMFAR